MPVDRRVRVVSSVPIVLVAALFATLASPAQAQRKSRITPPPAYAVAQSAETFAKEAACLVNGVPGPALAPYFSKERNPFVLATPTTFHFHATVGAGIEGLQVNVYRLRRHADDLDAATLSPRYWVDDVTSSDPTTPGEFNDVPLQADGGAYLIAIASPGESWTSREVKARCRVGFAQLWELGLAPNGALQQMPVANDTYDLTFTGLLVPPTRRDTLLRQANGNPLRVDGDEGQGDDTNRLRWVDPRAPMPTWTDVQKPIPFQQNRLRYRLLACSDEPLTQAGPNAGQRACLVLARFTPDSSKPCVLKVEGSQTLTESRPLDLLSLVGRTSLATFALVVPKAGEPLKRSAVRVQCGPDTFDGLPPGAKAILGNFTFAHTDLLVQALSRVGGGRSADRCPPTPAPTGESWSVFDQAPSDRRDVAVCAYRFASWRGDTHYRSFEDVGGAPEEAAFLARYPLSLTRTQPPLAYTPVLDGVGRYWLELPRPATGQWQLLVGGPDGARTLGTYNVTALPMLQVEGAPTTLPLPTLRASELTSGLDRLCARVPPEFDLARFSADGGLAVLLRAGTEPLPIDVRYAGTPADPRRLCPRLDPAGTDAALAAVRHSMLDGRPINLEVRQGERSVVPPVTLEGPKGIEVTGATALFATQEPLPRPLAANWSDGRVNGLCVQTALDLGAESELLSETRFDVVDDTGQHVGTFAPPPATRTTYFRKTDATAATHTYCATPTRGGLDWKRRADPASNARALRITLAGLECDDATLQAGRCAPVPLSAFETRLLADALRDTHAGFAWGPVLFWGLSPAVPTEWRSSLFFPLALISAHPSSTVSFTLETGGQGTLAAGLDDRPTTRARFAAAIGGYVATCLSVDLPRSAGALSPRLCAGAALDLLKGGITSGASGIAPSFGGAEVVPYVGFELQRWN